MTDGEIRDLLVERLSRVEGAHAETNQRLDNANAQLDHVIKLLDGVSHVLVSMKQDQDALASRVDRPADAITRGFTERDDRIEEIRRRVEQLERSTPQKPR